MSQNTEGALKGVPDEWIAMLKGAGLDVADAKSHMNELQVRREEEKKRRREGGGGNSV